MKKFERFVIIHWTLGAHAKCIKYFQYYNTYNYVLGPMPNFEIVI